MGTLFVISSQTLGYGIAGIMRKFLVWPAAMIWPSTLIHCAVFRTLHHDETNGQELQKDSDNNISKEPQWTMSRLRFFWLALFFQFLWYWIPGYIFPLLSAFSLFCLIDPNNVILSQVTGANGLGFGSFELDWNAWVAFLGSPIVVPLWYI